MLEWKTAPILCLATVLMVIFMVPQARAGVYTYGPKKMVVGSLSTYTVKEDESLIELARRFDLGYNEITVTNPSLDPFVPGKDVSVLLPTSWVLPDVGFYNGIVVNLSELRLYYFFEQKGLQLVRTFPVGIGSQGKDTPVGEFSVIERITNPAWHVPESIRKERPWLPAVVPPGKDNPLGSYALRLSLGDVLIHGTNRPYAVGRRDSHGCIRLYPEDISRLFKWVPGGVRVTIVRQPVKVGMRDNRVYIEVHTENAPKDVNYFDEAVSLLAKKRLLKYVNTEKLYRAIEQSRGMPVDISD